MKRALLLTALALAAILPACGGHTGVVLELESSLTWPEEVDGVLVEIRSQQYPTKTQAFELTEPFPHSVAVTLDGVKGAVDVFVSATRGGEILTTTQVSISIASGRMRAYRLVL